MTIITFTAGTKAKASEVNGNFTDVTDRFNTSTGHDHDGTDSKAFGWTLLETKDLSAGGVSTTTFNSIPSHRVLKVIVSLEPDFTSNTVAVISLRFNGDTSTNYEYWYYLQSPTTNTITTGATFANVGSIQYATGSSTAYPTISQITIFNAKGDTNLISSFTVDGIGHDGTGSYKPGGGNWINKGQDISSITVFDNGGSNFKGKISLYYLVEAD